MKQARKPTNRFFSVSRPLGQIGFAESNDGAEAAKFAQAKRSSRAGDHQTGSLGVSVLRRFIIWHLDLLTWRRRWIRFRAETTKIRQGSGGPFAFRFEMSYYVALQ